MPPAAVGSKHMGWCTSQKCYENRRALSMSPTSKPGALHALSSCTFRQLASMLNLDRLLGCFLPHGGMQWSRSVCFWW